MKNRIVVWAVALVVLVAVGGGWPVESYAKTAKGKPQVSSSKSKKSHVRKKKKRPAAFRRIARPFSALVVNAQTGEVVYEKNAASPRYPASLTKMMTLYLTFETLKSGALAMGDTMPVSEKASRQPETNISLGKGDRLEVEKAIESVVVRSANDSAMVLAEAIGKTEWNFALMMTNKAHELGMKNTVFRNPNGLPDNKQHTTAFDMARLAIALRRDFPEYYHYFSLQSFDYQGITYPGHNRVMERYPGVDGVKTGYIRASGFNLVTSIQRGGHNLVGVIIGGSSAASRDDQMIAMLDRAIDKLDKNVAGGRTDAEPIRRLADAR